MTDSNRIALGTLTVAALNASSSYLISNFTLASDQPYALPWGLSSPGTIKDYIERTEGLDGYAGGNGKPNTALIFDAMTPGMLQIWLAALFPNNVLTSAVTFKLRDDRVSRYSDGNYIYGRGLLHQPEQYPKVRPGGVVFDGALEFPLTRITYIVSEFSSAFSSAFAI